MKRYQMITFITIVLSVYILANLYIFIKGYNIIKSQDNIKLVYSITFILLAATFIAGKFLERNHSSVFADVLNIIGGFWMAFMLYSFLFLLLSDIILLLNKLLHFIPSGNTILFKKWAFLTSVVFTSLAIIIGFIIAVTPIVRRYDITINKPVTGSKEFRIAAISDIHLGSIIRRRSMNVLSGMLRDLKPDLTLFLGDIVDGEIGPVLRDDLLSEFKCPECKSGVYAITGNHEYIGGAYRTIPYIEKKGIRILKDEIITLPNGIQLIGRLDRDSFRFMGKERLSLEELIINVDMTKPVILLDHQPYNLDLSEKNGVDLQLSGHTHNGQMWPLTSIVKMIYEVSFGYKKKGNTQIIVSSGFGIWGPRIRLGSRSEILLINVRFSGIKK
jgi:predicted MPP superfamily phosphohydrolase